MSVPLLVISAAGVSGPDYPTILAALQADFQAIYGSDIDIDPDSQDGQLIAVFAQAIFDTQQSCIAVYNSFSPTTAQGAGLSSIVKINGMQRHIASSSQTPVNIVGVFGTPINNGLIGDNLNLGTQWALPASVTIPVSGTVTVTATCITQGATPAAANTLTEILTPTLGWQSVTNPAPATAGEPVETDAQLRQRQSTSTSLGALTNLESIYAAVADVPAVTRLTVYENDTDSTDVNGIPSHSIAAVVQGGDVTAIATAIADKKAPGTGTAGSISTVIIDSHGIADTIKFYPLTITQLDVVVTIKALTGFTTTTEVLIQQAVTQFINNLSIGEKSYYLRLVAPANLEGDAAIEGTGYTQINLDPISNTFTVTAIQQCLHGGSPSAADVVIAFNAAAACVVANVTVNVT